MGNSLSAVETLEENLLLVIDLVEDDVVTCHVDQNAILLNKEESILHLRIDSKEVSKLQLQIKVSYNSSNISTSISPM